MKYDEFLDTLVRAWTNKNIVERAVRGRDDVDSLLALTKRKTMINDLCSLFFSQRTPYEDAMLQQLSRDIHDDNVLFTA